jgi:hypothetical protein
MIQCPAHFPPTCDMCLFAAAIPSAARPVGSCEPVECNRRYRRVYRGTSAALAPVVDQPVCELPGPLKRGLAGSNAETCTQHLTALFVFRLYV